MNNTEFQNVTTRNTLLPERVADQIVQLIQSQDLKPGDKLPNEFELGSLLNVGRGTIRESVKILAARNVLEIQRGRGTFISKHPGQMEDPLGFAFYPDQLRLAFDLLEVRLQLEPWIASVAAEKATQKDIQELRARCEQVEKDILDGVDHLKSDEKFHMCISKCTRNEVVPKLIPIISYSVGLFGSINKRVLLSETIIGHRAIADAIAAHDPEAARKAMVAHLEQNRATLQEVATNQTDSKPKEK